jgi:hypothetical protein
MVRDILQTKEIDVLVIDLNLEGLSSIFEVKTIEFPKNKIIFTVVYLNRFMHQMPLKLVFLAVHKSKS